MYGDSSASLLYNDKGQISLYSYKLNYGVNEVSEHDTISYRYTYNADGSLNSLSSNYNAADFTATYSYDDFDRSSGYVLTSDSGTTTDYRNEVGYIYETNENNTSSRIKT